MHLPRRTFPRHRPMAIGALLLAVAALGAGVAFAATGDPDPSFNGGAPRLIDFAGTEDRTDLLAVAPDGSIVLAGCGCGEDHGIALARVSASGEPVDGFGDHGVVDDAPIAGPNSGPQALAVDAGGDILVGLATAVDHTVVIGAGGVWTPVDTAGQSDGFAVLRYAADGTRKGISRIDLGETIDFGRYRVAAVVPQSDGGVVVAGSRVGGPAGPSSEFILARLGADGELDPGFGEDGIVDGVDGRAFAGGHQAGGPPGSVVLVGQTDWVSHIVLARHLADGSVDPDYGGRFPRTGAIAWAGALAPDGSFYDVADAIGGPLLERFTPAGRPDVAWGGGSGVVPLPFPAHAVAVAADGKPVVAGTEHDRAAIARLTPDGALDPTFGDGGRVVLPLAAGADKMAPGDVVVQADGKAVVGGTLTRAPDPGDRRAWVTRLDGDPPPVTTSTTTTTSSATATTPAPPAPTGGVGGTAQPRPAVARRLSLPSARSCVSRRSFRIRLRIPAGAKPVAAVVKVDGRRVKVLKGARLRTPVDLKGLPRGHATVAIVVTLADGTTLAGQRRYRTCATTRR